MADRKAKAASTAPFRLGGISTINGPVSATLIFGKSIMSCLFRLAQLVATEGLRPLTQTQRLSKMAEAETSVITVPGMK